MPPHLLTTILIIVTLISLFLTCRYFRLNIFELFKNIKYQLTEIKLFFISTGIFVVIYAIVLGLPIYVGYRTLYWVYPTFLALALATLGPLTYKIIRTNAEKVLMAEQKKYQGILLRTAELIVNKRDMNRLLKLSVYVLQKTIKLSFASIFLFDENSGMYELKASRHSKNNAEEKFCFENNHLFVRYVYHAKEPFFYRDLPESIKQSINYKYDISLVIQVFIGKKMTGIILLGKKINGSNYTSQDIKILKVLSFQTALAVENARFFEEFKQNQERIFYAEKLASIGGMAEGIAHQIRNRLNHFSIAAGELKFEVNDYLDNAAGSATIQPKLKETFDYVIKISDSLIDNVKRTNYVVNGILSYARVEEKESFFSQFSMKEVINLAVDLVKIKHALQSVPIDIFIESHDIVYGIKSQILDTLYNLLENAFQSTVEMAEYGPSELRSTYEAKILITLRQEQDHALLEVADNGIGIKDANKSKIFAPFYTSKSSYKASTGIGMYLAKRMIEENHSGKIWFESTYTKGTKVFIKIPKARSASNNCGPDENNSHLRFD